MIPRYGAMGATIGTIGAEISVCSIQTYFVRKTLDISLYIKNSIPFIFVGILMFVITYGIGSVLGVHIYTLIIQIAIGVFVYGVFSYILFLRRGLLLYIKND